MLSRFRLVLCVLGDVYNHNFRSSVRDWIASLMSWVYGVPLPHAFAGQELLQ
jgi:hypothetical protein